MLQTVTMHLKNNNELLKLIDRLSIGNVCEQKIVAEKETKRIMQEKRLSGSLTYDNIKKLFFMTLHYKSNTAHLFIAAAASSNIKIKQLGYLGMQLEPNESQSFLLINTIKKDVVAKETRIMAMNFIANMCTRSPLFRDMLKKIDIQSNKTEFFQRELIAHYALNTVDSRIRIVEITTQRLFVKLQILVDNIDTLLRDEFVCENDIKYLQSIAMRTKDINLIIKILQFLRLYTKNCEETDLKAFCKFVESKIAHGSIINRDLLSIALSLEATEFLLSKSFDSVNAHGFIFKLVEAEEDYLNICAFRLIKQYKIHPKIAIYRIIEKGIKNAEHLYTLLDIVDDKNCAELYNEKSRSIKIMHSRHIRPDKINATWDEIVLRILRVCDDSLKVRLLTENMHLHTMTELNSVLSEQCCERLFDHIKDIQAIEAFSFLYKLISLLKYSHLSHIYEKHLPRIIDQYSVNVKTCDIKLFTNFVDCIYNNESIYYTYSFLKRITNEVLQTHCDALIKIHEDYCNIIESLMVEKYATLESGDFLYYSFRTIDNIKKQVTLKYMNNYNIDVDGSNEFYVVERKDDVWNKAVIELYDFEAKTVSIKINSSVSVPEKITLKLF